MIAIVRLRRIAIGVLLLILGVAITLALPVGRWRTGRMPVPPLTLGVPGGDARSFSRVWIDTDAACGHTPRTDVDDCLALRFLAAAPGLQIAGVSTVFGNAPLEVTERTTRELVQLLTWSAHPHPMPVYRGSDNRLAAALRASPLTIVALGPLTNVAEVLERQPNLRRNLTRLIAVMGRQEGHLFHPGENSGRGMLFGHGPVFRDFNFAADPDAVRELLAMRVPITLIPYDAARRVEITAADLNRLAADDKAGAWIAARSRGWLEYWQTDVGRSGFYPFDLLAAAYVVMPQLFRCARVRAWVGRDPRLFVPFFRPQGLLVEQRAETGRQGDVLYCPSVDEDLQARIHASW